MRTFLISFALLAAACGGGSHPAPAKPDTTAPAAAFTPTSFTVKVTGTGRPVIFIPGLTCDGSIWDETIAHLGGTVNAHVLSLAGFGAMPPIDQPLLPTVHDELVKYIAANHLDHPILVGHSLGGFMTFWVAETDSDKIGGIVAVDGAPFIGALFDPDATVATVGAQGKAMGDHMAGMKPDEFATAMSGFLGAMIGDQAIADRVNAVAVKSDPRTAGAAMELMFNTDLRPDLGKITVPALVIIAGDVDGVPQDQLVANWHKQVDLVPDHELVVVDKAKHFVMLDQPVPFYAALDRYLAK